MFRNLSLFIFLCSCSVYLNNIVSCESNSSDLISDLPGLAKVPSFKQYSGYLEGSTANYQLHYWFVESQNDPKTDPLVLWLNGGPGCSSIEGLLSENGPFTVLPEAKLQENPNSWNKIANVLYLEAPAGVGYSYAKDGNVTTDDDLTSLNNYHALLNFMKKFPEYKKRDFFITGESYGGVYVPTLAIRIIDDGVINLKGIAVGNGLTSYDMNDNSLIYFGAYHGLIGDDDWKYLIENCCDEDKTKERCMFTKSTNSGCIAAVSKFNSIINSGLDIYNLYAPCAGGVNVFWKKWIKMNKGSYSIVRRGNEYFSSDFGNLFRENPIVRNQRDILFEQIRSSTTPVNMAIPCEDTSTISAYMRNQNVITALNIAANLPPWDVCSASVTAQYVRNYQELSKQYTTILESGVRTFIYNGDIDMACNFLGDQWFVDSLDLDVKTKRRSWLYTDSDNTQQIGGFVKEFTSKNEKKAVLTFLTVRGAGHMVPTDRPLQAYKMYTSFLHGAQL